jgi:hypothetical protein
MLTVTPEAGRLLEQKLQYANQMDGDTVFRIEWATGGSGRWTMVGDSQREDDQIVVSPSGKPVIALDHETAVALRDHVLDCTGEDFGLRRREKDDGSD